MTTIDKVLKFIWAWWDAGNRSAFDFAHTLKFEGLFDPDVVKLYEDLQASPFLRIRRHDTFYSTYSNEDFDNGYSIVGPVSLGTHTSFISAIVTGLRYGGNFEVVLMQRKDYVEWSVYSRGVHFRTLLEAFSAARKIGETFAYSWTMRKFLNFATFEQIHTIKGE